MFDSESIQYANNAEPKQKYAKAAAAGNKPINLYDPCPIRANLTPNLSYACTIAITVLIISRIVRIFKNAFKEMREKHVALKYIISEEKYNTIR